MKGTSSYGIAFVLTIVFAASCSHAPRLAKNTEQVASFRAQYLEYHPDDKFKKQIMASEVRKGMNFMQVLASWGLPNKRIVVAEGGDETWTYYAMDEVVNTLTSYELVFGKNELSHWVISGDTPSVTDLSAVPTVSSTPDPGSTGGSLKRK